MAKEDKAYMLPARTFMQSPKGIPFVVRTCTSHSNTQMLVRGAVDQDFSERLLGNPESEDIAHELM